MGWLITLGILTLIAVTPVGARFRYNADGVYLAVICGLFKIRILPAKKKGKKPEKKKKAKKSPKEKKTAAKQPELKTQPDPAPKEPQPKEKGGSWTDFLPLVKVALNLVGEFITRLRFDNLQLKLIMAGGDPCDLGINYGRAWAAVGNLMPRLERVFVIRKRDIEVECDFWAPSTTVIASADITITIGRILSLVCVLAFRGIREYLKINKKRKGGAAK